MACVDLDNRNLAAIDWATTSKTSLEPASIAGVMSETPADDRKIWQPLHPAIRDKLDPQYVDYHDKYLQYIVPDELKAWDESVRSPKGTLPPGGTQPVPVGSIEDFVVGRFRVRVYTPTGESDERGWPALVWFHGGGWAVGGLNNGRDLCSWTCEGIYL